MHSHFDVPEYCRVILFITKQDSVISPLRIWCYHFIQVTSVFISQFVCVESLVTAVVDMYPETFRRGYRRELLILGMSIVSFFIGLIMCTEVRLSFSCII